MSALNYTFGIMTKASKLLLCVIAVVLIGCAGCRHSGDKNFRPSKLAGDLYSGQSLQSAERKLDMMSGNFNILIDRKPLPSDGRPPYRLLVISKPGAKIDGQTGELVLTFFNDRLMTTQLYPSDLALARAEIESADKLSLSGNEAHIAPSTRVWVGEDENGRSYIGWIDKTLQSEQDAWVKQYGQ